MIVCHPTPKLMTRRILLKSCEEHKRLFNPSWSSVKKKIIITTRSVYYSLHKHFEDGNQPLHAGSIRKHPNLEVSRI